MQFLTNLTASKNRKQHSDEVATAHMVGTISFAPTVHTSNAICCSCSLDTGSWILDSGATDHMTFNISALHDLHFLVNPLLVSLPNGYKIQVIKCGKLKLSDSPVLSHVLLVPHFKYNLLPIKKLARQLQCEVVFSEDRCTL